jgi:hypothetical protein
MSMKKVDGHTELNQTEATQATKKPPTQYVLAISLAAVIVCFVALAVYWAM